MLSIIISSGGWVLFGLVLASLFGLTVTIERCWRLLPLRARFLSHLRHCEDLLPQRGAQAVVATLDGHQDAMARMLRTALGQAQRGPDAVRALAMDIAQQEVPGIERGLGALAMVAQIAPLLGLLGTVVGLMEAFESAQAADRVTTALLSGGIYKALGTTAVGLSVAIPAWIAYGLLSGVAGRTIEMLAAAANEVPVLLPDTQGHP